MRAGDSDVNAERKAPATAFGGFQFASKGLLL
jgi:hypothetical protein